MTAWHKLDAANYANLEEYNNKFWKALLPVSSYQHVPLSERIEKYCCGLPKEIHDYCTKTRVTNMTQLIKNATTTNALLQGRTSGFKGSKKIDIGKLKKTGKSFKASFVAGQRRRSRPKMSPEERQSLMDAKNALSVKKKGMWPVIAQTRRKRSLKRTKVNRRPKKLDPLQDLYQMLLARVLRMLQSYAGLGAKYEIRRL